MPTDSDVADVTSPRGDAYRQWPMLKKDKEITVCPSSYTDDNHLVCLGLVAWCLTALSAQKAISQRSTETGFCLRP